MRPSSQSRPGARKVMAPPGQGSIRWDVSRAAPLGLGGSGGAAGGSALPEGEGGDVGDPVAVGAQDEVVGAGPADGLGDGGALGGGGFGVVGADFGGEGDLVDGAG